MRTLVTGGCGFIGSHLVAALADSGHEVCVLDDLSAGRRENIAGSPARLVEASIDEPSALREALAEVDTLFHLAAMVSVPVSIRRPAACLRTNVTATSALLEEAVASGVSTVVFASSAAVYGSGDRGAQKEDQALRPSNPYGVSKVTGEDLCRLLDSSGRVRAVSLRFFNIYGPRQDPRGSYGSVVPEFARRALAGDPLHILGDGGQTRDFLFVEDAARAAVHAATNTALRGAYNVGSGEGIAIRDLAERIIALSGSSSGIAFEPRREGDVRHSRADTERLLATGWKPRSSLDEGLAATLVSYG